MENYIKTEDLFDLNHTVADGYLGQFQYPWQALGGLKDYIIRLGKTLGEEYVEIAPCVWVHKSAKVAESAKIASPAIIDRNTEIRHCAYIRGSVLTGKNCVVGNSTEIKNSILFDGACVPHFNYVGDSILGFCAHLGAGAITSNVKCDKSKITVNGTASGLKKLGAMVGDGVEVGCNSVLNAGAVIGRNTTVYPLSFVRGIIPPNSIFKRGETVKKR